MRELGSFRNFGTRATPSGERSRAFLRRFFQSYAWASAILVDELDAGGFECAADGEVIGGRKRNRILCNLSAADRIYAKG
jgi:hypothetical protein